MGVNKSATNIAVLGDLGWFPLSINAMKSCLGYWFYLLQADECNLIFHTYRDNLSIKEGLSNCINKLLCCINFGHVWENRGTFSEKRCKFAIFNKLKDRYTRHWHQLLFNDERINGANKLRTFRKFKKDFKREMYLFTDVDRQCLSDFIKIRISNSYLNIERGRYLKLPVEQRICQLCNLAVEDEFHFVMICDKLRAKREELFNNVGSVVPAFLNMSTEEQFIFLLSSQDLDVCKITVTGISDMYRTNLSLKQNL